MREVISVIPVSFIFPEEKKFQPRWFGATDYIEQKRLGATPRLSPKMVDIGRDANGRIWASPKAWRI